MVGAQRNGRSGHDLDGLTLRQAEAGKLDRVSGADLTGDSESSAGAKVGCVAGVAVAGGAVEGGLVPVGQHGAAQYTAKRVGQGDDLCLARVGEAQRRSVLADQGEGFRESQDRGKWAWRHILILKLFGELFTGASDECGRRAGNIPALRARGYIRRRSYFLAL
jgi:hypothetical protein